MHSKKLREGRKSRRSPSFFKNRLRLHPLFLLVGVWYACTGELFLFLLSTLVALQHECAHAFAAAKLGYKLNAVVLMPYGAVIDGDLHGISLKDELTVALWGPLCNLVTAFFFAALWWFFPATYPFTDTAYYASLAIALVNLLPAYPLDGGRVMKCLLTRAFLQKNPNAQKAEGKARAVCRVFSLLLGGVFIALFGLRLFYETPNFTLLAFGFFLIFGALGNKNKIAAYEKMQLPLAPSLERGAEVKRVAIAASCPVKDALRFLSRGRYLVLEVYDERGFRLFDLPQNELSRLFTLANTPYEPLDVLYGRAQKE